MMADESYDLRRGRGLLTVGAGVLLISFDSLLVRIMTIRPVSIMFWRGLFSAVGFAVLACIFSRPRNFADEIGVAGLAVAVLTAVSTGLFVVSLRHTTVAHALTIIAAAPAITAVIAHVTIGEHLPSRTWLTVAVVTVGVIIVFWSSWGGPQVAGDVSALAASISFSGSLVVLRRHQNVNRLAALALGGIMLAIASCLTALIAGSSVGAISINTHDALASAADALVVIPVSLALITQGPKYLRAAEVSLLLLLETVFGPTYVWLVLGERPALAVVLSALIIIGALGVHTVLDSVAEKRVVGRRPT
jgi:drug/metabolite transporter (DMT)-like permease